MYDIVKCYSRNTTLKNRHRKGKRFYTKVKILLNVLETKKKIDSKDICVETGRKNA